MEKIDLDEIIRHNPHLNRKSLEALQKSLQELTAGVETHYRLAPIGTHRATVGEPDAAHKETTRIKSYPGF